MLCFAPTCQPATGVQTTYSTHKLHLLHLVSIVLTAHCHTCIRSWPPAAHCHQHCERHLAGPQGVRHRRLIRLQRAAVAPCDDVAGHMPCDRAQLQEAAEAWRHCGRRARWVGLGKRAWLLCATYGRRHRLDMDALVACMCTITSFIS